jgi:hypothetical protein
VGKREIERRSFVYRGLGPHPAAMALDDALDQRKSHTVPSNSSLVCNRWKTPNSFFAWSMLETHLLSRMGTKLRRRRRDPQSRFALPRKGVFTAFLSSSSHRKGAWSRRRGSRNRADSGRGLKEMNRTLTSSIFSESSGAANQTIDRSCIERTAPKRGWRSERWKIRWPFRLTPPVTD